MLSTGGFSAYRMVFGSNPVNLFGCEGDNGELLFPKDTFLAGQIAQHWRLGMRPQEAALRVVANCKLGRLLARDK